MNLRGSASTQDEVWTPDDRERVAFSAANPSRADRATIAALDEVLSSTRRLEDVTSAALVLPMVRERMNTIRGLVAHAPSKVRGAAVELASQCDRYFGWLLLATNQGKQAVDYFDSAISLATETNEPPSSLMRCLSGRTPHS
jgi:hypothetical protein